MAITDHSLGDLVASESFKKLNGQQQFDVRKKWIQGKTQQLRAKHGDKFQPSMLIEKLKSERLIDQSSTAEQFLNATIREAETTVGSFLQGAADIGQNVSSLAENSLNTVTEFTREKAQERLNALPEEADSFAKDLLEAETKGEGPATLAFQLTANLAEGSKELFALFNSALDKAIPVDVPTNESIPESIRTFRNEVSQAAASFIPAIKGAQLGGRLGAFLSSFAVNSGAEFSGNNDSPKAIATGFAQAILDHIVPTRVIEKLGKTQLGEFITSSVLEGGTEAAQSLISEFSKAEDAGFVERMQNVMEFVQSPEGQAQLAKEAGIGAILGLGAETVASQQANIAPPIQTQGDSTNANNNQETTPGTEIDQGARESPIQPPQLQGQTQAQTGQQTVQGGVRPEEGLTPLQVENKIILGGKHDTFDENSPRALVDKDAIEAKAFSESFGDTIRSFTPPRLPSGLKPRAPGPKPKFKLKPENNPQKVKRIIQDANDRIRVAQEQLSDQGVRITATNDVFQAKSLMPKRVSAKIEHIEKNVMDPFAELVASSNVTLNQLNSYALAKHASERNQQMGWDGASSLTNQQASDILANFTAEETQSLEVLRLRLNQIIENTLDYQVRTGIITQEDFNDIRSNYQFYVPLGRDFTDAHQNIRGARNTKGTSVTGSGIFRAFGSDRPVLPVVPQVFNRINEVIQQAEANRVATTLANLVRETNDPTLWSIRSQQAIGEKFGDDGELIFRKPAEDEIGFRENGKQKFIKIEDYLFRRAMKNEGLSRSIPALQAPLRLMSKLITQYDLTFAARNFNRDLIEGLINLQEIRSLELPASQRSGLTRDVVKNIPQINRALFRHLRGKRSDKWSSVIESFQLEGGEAGSFWLEDVKELNKRFIRAEKKYENQGFQRLLNPVQSALQVIRDINRTAENSIRLSTYHELTKRGIIPTRAARIAAELTIDFNRQGEIGPTIKSWTLFINPSIQGTARVGRAAAQSGRVRAAAVAMITAGMIRTYIAQLLDDVEDDAIYEYSKNTSITLPTGTGNSVTLGFLPYGYNSMFAVGSNMAYYSLGKKTREEAMRDTALTAMDSFNPVGGSRLSFSQAIPSVLKPLHEIDQNEGWHGGPIFPDGSKWEPELPDHKKYWRNTSNTMKILTAWMADAGVADVSPESLEYAVSQYGGGISKGMFNTSATLGAILVDEKTPKSKHIPFVREVFRTVDVDRYDKNTVYGMFDKSRITLYNDLQVKRFNESMNRLANSGSLKKKTRKRLIKEFNKAQSELRAKQRKK